MATASLEDFASFLRAAGGRDMPATRQASLAGQRSMRDLWQASQLSANDFADQTARFYSLPRASLTQMLDAAPLAAKFARRFLNETTVFPYRSADGAAYLAVADPSDIAARRAAEIVLGGTVVVAVASFEDIAIALAERAGDTDAAQDVTDAAPQHGDDVESLRDLASGAPVVRAVNDLLERAMQLRATDLHLEPFRTGLTVRLRVDGLLQAAPTPTGVLPQALISRIKILAGLNIAERRLPQDGAARLRIGRSEIDARVAIMPGQYGESAVIRLLPRDRGVLQVPQLGFADADAARLTRLLALPHGMIVITGPTGSGKTTTLATLLTALNETTRKILTIEDPIEYELPGVVQAQVKPSIGLTFSHALRAFVRHDPDVIMVGEVRDAETADIAVHAALTGHLVFTTLHTETAAAAFPRLIDLGVESFLLKSTIRAVIAQRLVRLLCQCRLPYVLTPGDLAEDPRYASVGVAAGETLYRPNGCERCGGTGYRGRAGVFEVIEMTDALRGLVTTDTDAGALEEAAIRAGMTTMLSDGIAKCRTGTTSLSEVFRVATLR